MSTSAATRSSTLGADPSVNTLTTTAPVTTANIITTGPVKQFVGQGGGWNDIIGQLVLPVTGAGKPVYSQIGATVFYAWKFGINDECWFNYHIPHDYSPATNLFLHAHWITDGTNTGLVRWEFSYTFAKGFNQGNYNFASPTVDVTAEQAAAGTAYRHMVTEVTSGDLAASCEVDGILMVRMRRIAPTSGSNSDGVFLIMADVHYQALYTATKNKAPNFYT